jgi:hypothetical protein
VFHIGSFNFPNYVGSAFVILCGEEPYLAQSTM